VRRRGQEPLRSVAMNPCVLDLWNTPGAQVLGEELAPPDPESVYPQCWSLRRRRGTGPVFPKPERLRGLAARNVARKGAGGCA